MSKKADKTDSFRVGHDALDNAWKSGSNCAENETIIDAISTLSACSNDDSPQYLEDGSVGINCRWFGTPFYGCVPLCKDQFKSTKDAFEVN